jgi:hypothetical protein
MEGATGYLDFYAKRDSVYGIVLNLAFGEFNYEGALLAGLSFYIKAAGDHLPINFYPIFSIGVMSTEDYAVSMGIALEKPLSDNFSLVLTPGINGSSNSYQVIMALDLVIK